MPQATTKKPRLPRIRLGLRNRWDTEYVRLLSVGNLPEPAARRAYEIKSDDMLWDVARQVFHTRDLAYLALFNLANAVVAMPWHSADDVEFVRLAVERLNRVTAPRPAEVTGNVVLFARRAKP
jgi:hypothetical protein